MKRFFYISCLISLLISSCSIDKESNYHASGDFLFLDVNKVNNEIYTVKLSDLMETVEIIQLDSSTEEAYTPIFRMAISDNYFVTTCPPEYPVKLYNRKNGRFIRNIGSRGQGPGEYQRVWNLTLDEPNNRIYLGQPYNPQIYSYGLDGKYYPDETIYLPEQTQGKFTLYKEKDKLAIIQAPYGAYHRGNTNYEAEMYFCWLQDIKGNIMQYVPVTEDIAMPRGSSDIWVSKTMKESPIYSIALQPISYTRPDTLYHYNSNTNKLYPVYATNAETARYIFTTSVETPLHYYTIQGFYDKKRSINPENLEEWKILQVNKKTSEGRYIRLINDLLGDIEINSYGFFQEIKDNYGYIVYHPLDLKEQLEEALVTNTNMSEEVRKRVVNMKNTLTEDSNDVLVICKFKKQ